MIGCQTPTYSHHEPYLRTQGNMAIELSKAYGMKPHEWQGLVLKDWLAVDEDNRLLHSLCVLTVPRQNGKTGVSDPRETFGLVVRGEKILHTAQEFQTAKKAFDRLREKFGSRKGDPFAKFPELNAMVEKYTTSANQMVLDLVNGGHIEFRTRGSDSDMGRGGTFDLVVIDEGQSYTEEQDAALSPLNSAAPGGSPQTIIMGTVPDPAKPHKGAKFYNIRTGAYEYPQQGLCYHEWSVPEIGDVLDETRWYEANPSLGYQLLISGLRKDVATMRPETFAMEHLGWWPKNINTAQYLINQDEWMACATDEAPQGKADAFAVKFSPDGTLASIAVAVVDGGITHVELVHQQQTVRGIREVAELVVRNAEETPFVIDGRAGAQALIDRVENHVPKGSVELITTADVIAADAAFLNGIREQTITWFKPKELTDENLKDDALSSSILKATRRSIGSSGGWGFGGEEPTAIEACALAAWAAKKSIENDVGEMEVYF